MSAIHTRSTLQQQHHHTRDSMQQHLDLKPVGLVLPNSQASSRESSYDHVTAWREKQAALALASAPSSVGQPETVDNDERSSIVASVSANGNFARKSANGDGESVSNDSPVRPKRMATTPHRAFPLLTVLSGSLLICLRSPSSLFASCSAFPSHPKLFPVSLMMMLMATSRSQSPDSRDGAQPLSRH